MSGLAALPSRSVYLPDQRNRFGRRVVGVFPGHYPRELFWAFGALAVEIWDPPVDPVSSGAHLQSYICSVARLGLELILQGGAGQAEGFLFPHTCDSVQNLASVVHDYIGVDKPCWFFYVPKAPYTNAARDYYISRVEALSGELAKTFGPLDPAKLSEAVEKGARVTELTRKLYGRNAAGTLDLAAADFYRLVRAGEYLHPDDLIPLMEECLGRPPKAPDKRPTVILSGVLPNPAELLEIIEGAGLRIGHDDFYSCSRRLMPASLGIGMDPHEALAERFMTLPPCSTRCSPIAERLEYLSSLVKMTGARGVVFNIVKFCEAELFDVPALVDGLAALGVRTLVLETELNSGFTGQMRTRVEAFAELLMLEGP